MDKQFRPVVAAAMLNDDVLDDRDKDAKERQAVPDPCGENQVIQDGQAPLPPARPS